MFLEPAIILVCGENGSIIRGCKSPYKLYAAQGFDCGGRMFFESQVIESMAMDRVILGMVFVSLLMFMLIACGVVIMLNGTVA